MGRTPADVEEWLGIKRCGPGQGAGKWSRRILRESTAFWIEDWEGALLYPAE